jgi:ParB/RepB/Spo0J family partition protein
MTTSTKLIAIKNIEVANRLRKLRPEKVEEIAKSIKAGLLLQPIMVRPKPKGGYLLVYGAHRLEAERQLKSETVECRIVKMTDDQALLAEIDENLCRADLTAAERAIHTRERKKIFEAAHPETKRGSGGGRAKAANSKIRQEAKMALSRISPTLRIPPRRPARVDAPSSAMSPKRDKPAGSQ